jgi:hypothetical protein
MASAVRSVNHPFICRKRLLICLMKLRRYPEALEVAERGKSRTLIDLLTLRDLRPHNALPEVVEEYELAEMPTLRLFCFG